MNSVVILVVVVFAATASAGSLGLGWAGHGVAAVNYAALSPVGPSGVVTGHGASGPSGVVTGAGAVGPSGVVNGHGAVGPTGPNGHGIAIAAAPAVLAVPALDWGHGAGWSGVGAGWSGVGAGWGLGHGAWH